MDDDVINARFRAVEAVFDRITTRDGTGVEWGGDSVDFTDTHTIDRASGRRTPMLWCDRHAGEELAAAVRDGVEHSDIVNACLRAAARSQAGAELHELTEWFHYDGRQVWDPHPNQRRHGDIANSGGHIRFEGDPARTCLAGPAVEICDISPTVAQRIANELCDAVSVGVYGTFSVAGDHLVHTARYPDRDTGEPREFTWSREILGDLYVTAAGNTAAAARSRLLEEMYVTAAQSIVHEIAEWLCYDGKRYFDPHPEVRQQHDLIWPVIEFHTSPILTGRASATH